MKNSTREIFSRTFPDLYKDPEPCHEADAAEDCAGGDENAGDYETEEKAQTSAKQAEMLPDESETEPASSCKHEPPLNANMELYAMRMQDIKDQVLFKAVKEARVMAVVTENAAEFDTDVPAKVKA